MIQAKRESSLGPQRIRDILNDVDETDPPYGYILIAAANFSKQAYDVFRAELRRKGVLEFYMWGKAELEDMLYLPKNDRILFAFFGVSLVSKRRSRVTEVRSNVLTKNKLIRTLGEGQSLNAAVLLRDLADTRYPFAEAYADFDENPRWKRFTVFGHHPLGLTIHDHEYFAYVDLEKNEWDYTDKVDRLDAGRARDQEKVPEEDLARSVEDFWRLLPRANRAVLAIDGLLHYVRIALVDDKGDTEHDCPHLYLDSWDAKGLFQGKRQILTRPDRNEWVSTEDLKRVEIFPEVFSPARLGTIHETKPLELDARTQEALRKYEPVDTLYETDGRMAHLKVGDIVPIAAIRDADQVYFQVTHRYRATKGSIIKSMSQLRSRAQMEWQLQRQLTDVPDDELINVLEVELLYRWKLDEMRAAEGKADSKNPSSATAGRKRKGTR